jgi:hypothetical protein
MDMDRDDCCGKKYSGILIRSFSSYPILYSINQISFLSNFSKCFTKDLMDNTSLDKKLTFWNNFICPRRRKG